MHPLSSYLDMSLKKFKNDYDKETIKNRFPVLSSTSSDSLLVLRKYVFDIPESYYDETVYNHYYKWLNKRDELDREALLSYYNEYMSEINRSLLFLKEINREKLHDTIINVKDEYNLILYIEKNIHPLYLRLVESVLYPFLHSIAYFRRIDKGKKTIGLNLWSVYSELFRSDSMILISKYKHIIRNGIAHGGITYLQNEIKYNDRKGNEEIFLLREIMGVFDDLVDTCNAIAAALTIFFHINHDKGYEYPRELLLQELQEQTKLPWWQINGCVSTDIRGKQQLSIYAQPTSSDRLKIIWSIIQTGILAEYYSPGYDRYFISMKSKFILPSCAAFNGNKLRFARLSGFKNLSKYEEALEEDYSFFIPKRRMPRFIGSIDTFSRSLRINLPQAKREFCNNLGIPKITVKNAEVHRSSWGNVLKGNIIFSEIDDKLVKSKLRKYKRVRLKN